MKDITKNGSAGVYLGLLFLSISILTSEILLMRIISLVFSIILVYIVIGIAMLGFSAAGTFLAVFPSFHEKKSEGRLAWLALIFSILTPIAYYLSLTPAPLAIGKVKFLLYLIFVSLVMTVHFFLAGLIISFLFTKRVWQVNRLYFINLLGSGLGCFLLIQSIRSLGGEGLILLVTLLGALSTICFAIGYSKKGVAGVALVYAVCILLLLPHGKEVFHLWPTLYGKQLGLLFHIKKQSKLEYQAWDPIARVDVASMEDEHLYMPDKLPFKYATNDGSAGTFIIGFQGKDFKDVEFTDWGTMGLPYWLKKNAEVLIIGLGGAPDVMAALHYGAKKIYGIEISERMIEVVRDEFKAFANYPYQHPSVEVIHDEGRSYVRRMKEKVDLIQMTGVDTLAAQVGGNFVMSENFLYTVEAFKEYFQHLRDDGILCITRFVINPEYPEKGLRTSATGVRALRELGVERPERNFIVVSHGIFLATLMKRTAFTQSELDAFMEAFQKYNIPKEEMWDPMPFLKGIIDIRYQEGRRLLYKPGDFSLDSQFSKYFRSVSEGTEQQFIADYPWNMKPCTDNRPFFFVAERWDSFFRNWSHFKKFPPVGFLFQIMQLLWFGVLTLTLVLLPLAFFHRKGLRTKGSKACILYFTCLGLGFMMVEIGFMQKFTLFLGHPTYSVSVILFSLLCFSGLGSLTSGFLKMDLRRIILFSVLCLAGISVLYALILDAIFQHFLAVALGTRIILSVLLVAPLAFFMGMPFPTGLRIVERQALAFVPWAWGINGSASVIAIFLASMMAVFAGFSVVVACAVLIYLLGMFVMVTSHEET